MTGLELKKMRCGALVTQPELAKALGVSVKTISRWELGETAIRDVYVAGIRAVLEKLK